MHEATGCKQRKGSSIFVTRTAIRSFTHFWRAGRFLVTTNCGHGGTAVSPACIIDSPRSACDPTKQTARLFALRRHEGAP